ncbi:MAG TPA: hypothetical protein PKM09_08140, partial [Bacillota bacterium]|nr:hypothetical protein [Bacillota bacterium]
CPITCRTHDRLRPVSRFGFLTVATRFLLWPPKPTSEVLGSYSDTRESPNLDPPDRGPDLDPDLDPDLHPLDPLHQTR